jgi:pre-mRNA-splicing factor SPF27
MERDGLLLFMENEQYNLVDALPYIDTQLGSTEVAQQVKLLIDEEMAHFKPRDYLSSLPAPELLHLGSEIVSKEFERIEAGAPSQGIDTGRYKVDTPEGADAQDEATWKKQGENLQMQLEYNRLRHTNLEMLERWGNKAWIAHSVLVRAIERILGNEANGLRTAREEVNKKRKLDQISCGNELRKLNNELESYSQDNAETGRALWALEAEVERLRRTARERGLQVEEAEVVSANGQEKTEKSENGSTTH